jgi:ectoine hydroxylase-related dioxygenase (phytanoyl-CoA dioxygenase family)
MDRGEVAEVLGRHARMWARDGYFQVPKFLSESVCQELIDAAVALLHNAESGVVVRTEDNLPKTPPIEERVSKLYRLHHRAPFEALCTSPAILAHITPLISGNIDIFLSQVVWKLPGAHGQPWHQDASIFPFEPSGPIVGAWIALTDATEDTSCLQVVPGSHHDGVLEHAFDRTDETRGRYFQVRQQSADEHQTLSAQVGDLIVFDSRLLHRSTDNNTSRSRTALTFHYARSGTVDRTAEAFGQSPYNYWLPVHRASG